MSPHVEPGMFLFLLKRKLSSMLNRTNLHRPASSEPVEDHTRSRGSSLQGAGLGIFWD